MFFYGVIIDSCLNALAAQQEMWLAETAENIYSHDEFFYWFIVIQANYTYHYKLIF